MDAFIRSLAISNNSTAEDVCYSCAKILDWLTVNSETELSYKDVETIIKGMVFITESLKLFGKNLQQTLVQRYPLLKWFFESEFAKFDSENLNNTLYRLCVSIMQTKNGFRHVFVLDRIMNSLQDVYNDPIKMENVSPSNSNASSFSNNHTKFHSLITRLFQLPPEQIENAMDRILEVMHFNILGFTLFEPKTSVYFDKCCILEKKLCDKLSHGDVSRHFLHTMFVTASTGERGMEFYFKCLKNTYFFQSLSLFFVSYLGQISGENQYELHLKHSTKSNYNLTNMLFLIQSALTITSPCRVKLYNKLYDSDLPNPIVDVINRMTFIYSY